MRPCVGREHYRLSVTDGCRWRGGDRTNMPQHNLHLVVKTAHSRKFLMSEDGSKSAHKG